MAKSGNWFKIQFNKEKSLLLTTKQWFSDESVEKIDAMRNFSDDFAKIFTLFMLFVFGTSFLFNKDYYNANIFYYWFVFLMGGYLTIDNIVSKDFYDQRKFLFRKPDLEIHYGIRLIVYCLISFVGYMLFIFIIWIPISNSFPTYSASQVKTNENIDLLFQLSIVAPLEEMVFRGLGMLLFTYCIFRILGYEKNTDVPKKYYIAVWIISAILIGFLFGYYHIYKYLELESYPLIPIIENGVLIGYISVWQPILFLSLLGVYLGLVRYRFGLFPAILIHFINNVIASAVIFGMFGII